MTVSLFPSEPQLHKYTREWTAAGRDVNGVTLTPFTAKVLYAFGMMRHLVESAGHALTHKPPYGCFYISAFLLGCGAIELLGRCVSGDDLETSGATRRLQAGLREISSISLTDRDTTKAVVTTNHRVYSIADCCALRNFCAHGGSAGRVAIDIELVDEVLKKLSQSMDDYWDRLRDVSQTALRDRFAHAAVAPLFAGPGPDAILVGDVYRHVQSGHTISDGLMFRDAWQTYRLKHGALDGVRRARLVGAQVRCWPSPGHYLNHNPRGCRC